MEKQEHFTAPKMWKGDLLQFIFNWVGKWPSHSVKWKSMARWWKQVRTYSCSCLQQNIQNLHWQNNVRCNCNLIVVYLLFSHLKYFSLLILFSERWRLQHAHIYTKASGWLQAFGWVHRRTCFLSWNVYWDSNLCGCGNKRNCEHLPSVGWGLPMSSWLCMDGETLSSGCAMNSCENVDFLSVSRSRLFLFCVTQWSAKRHSPVTTLSQQEYLTAQWNICCFVRRKNLIKELKQVVQNEVSRGFSWMTKRSEPFLGLETWNMYQSDAKPSSQLRGFLTLNHGACWRQLDTKRCIR